MPHQTLAHCKTCRAKLGKRNTSGYCTSCANRKNARSRRGANAGFNRILKAYRAASPAAAARFRQFLEKEQKDIAARLAVPSGETLTAQLTPELDPAYISCLWEIEQGAVGLPDIRVEAANGQLTIKYFRRPCPSWPFSSDEIKFHFESAVRRVHRSARIEWLPKTGTQIKKLIETPQKPYLRPNGEPPDPRPTETRRQTLTPSGPA